MIKIKILSLLASYTVPPRAEAPPDQATARPGHSAAGVDAGTQLRVGRLEYKRSAELHVQVEVYWKSFRAPESFEFFKSELPVHLQVPPRSGHAPVTVAIRKQPW